MDNVEKDLMEIDYKIEYYKSFIFEDGKRESKIKNNNFLLRKGCKLTYDFLNYRIFKIYLADNILSLLDQSPSPSPSES